MKLSNKSLDRASEYVQKHARYDKDAPRRPYFVRYPATASHAFIAKDTWELVEKVAQVMEAERLNHG